MSPDPAPLVVYRGSGKTGAFVWSPFVTKLEARLRFAGISYKVGTGSPASAPRGKIPYVEIGPAEEQLGDSALIIQRLVTRRHSRRPQRPPIPRPARPRPRDPRAVRRQGILLHRAREVVRQLRRHARGRLTDDEVAAAKADADATVFGFVAGSLVCEAAPTTAKIVRSYPVVVKYAERIHQKFFPDYEKWD
ncbi:hypothetical protein QQZ08_007082 [Neonectria magnoliae]|uniref:Thioredoxin-like fold domain-containing protein n=1 Tax=Neonectria magnoliae TaxID=2732573 RepID=A0ABR1I0J2_9HYPO